MQLTFNTLDELIDFCRWTGLLAEPVLSDKEIATRIAQLAYNGHFTGGVPKIQAIKHYRNFMGCGLKEAKEAIEATSYYYSKPIF